MKLSVALCTYNGEMFLREQLDSILHQTKEVNELVIVDDCSIDGTVKIIKEYQIQYPNTISLFINDKNHGAKKNFEIALSKCDGDLIFLSDQDDIWMPSKVEEIVHHFIENPHLELVFTNGLLIDQNNRNIKTTLFEAVHFDDNSKKQWRANGPLQYLIGETNKITGATVAIKRNLFLQCSPFDLPSLIWHDLWLGLHAALQNNLDWLDKPLIYYRLHNNQQVGVILPNTKKSNDSKLREILYTIRESETQWLSIVERMLTYSDSALLRQAKKSKIRKLKLVNLRLNHSSKFINRSVGIIKNFNLYFNSFGKPIRSVIRDILRPA